MVCPYPFRISIRMSQMRSPELLSNLTLHQFRRPMMYLLLGWLPSVSFSKMGSYADMMHQCPNDPMILEQTHHGLVCVGVMQGAVSLRRERRHHSDDAVRRSAATFNKGCTRGWDITYGVFTIAPSTAR